MWCVSFSSSHKKTSKLSNIILHQFEGLHKLWDTPRIEFTITSIDSKYAFTGNSYKHNGKVYINGYFHCNSPSVGITTCFFVPEGFRPKIKCGSACYTDDDVNFNNIGAVKIDTNGDITIYFPTVYSTCVYTSIVYDID